VASTPTVIRIGQYDVDPATGEVRHDGETSRLQPQTVSLLLVLVENVGQVVTREELHRRLWPDTSVDFEDGLHHAIARLREALHDSAQTPRFVETVPRRGYRFIAPVKCVGRETPASARAPQIEAGAPAVAGRARGWRRMIVAAAGIASFAAPGGKRVRRATGNLCPADRLTEDLTGDPREADETDSRAAAPAAVAGWRPPRSAFVAVGAIVAALAGTATLWPLRRTPPPRPRLVHLTADRLATGATFSPDGNQIAFQSMGEGDGRWHVWLKLVGDVETRRLTTGSAPECCPAWSPDGTHIAVVRTSPGSVGIDLVSPVSGSTRRLVGFPVAGPLSWSPDGLWLAAARGRAEDGTTPESGGIHLIPVEGGEPRAVTFPKPPLSHQFPAFSPDGRQLAFATCNVPEIYPTCDVYVLPLDPQARPQAEARRLTWQRTGIFGLAWTRDSRSIVWGSGLEGNYLWRVSTDGGSPPEKVELAGYNAYAPSTARSRDRLAFSRTLFDSVIYRLPIGGAPAPFIDSAARDLNAQYSPDGRRIAFASRRSGDRNEIWLVDADGANATRLTRGSARFRGSPRWSPDGRTIAFDAWSDDGQWDIWTIGVDESAPRQVTHDPLKAHLPSFSRDGRWIYFTSHRTGREEVWRVAPTGGPEEQVTRDGGTNAFESLDGRTLFYMRSPNGALLARPTPGGAERTVAGCVNLSSYAVASRGIFYVACNAADARAHSERVVHYWNAQTGQDRIVGRFEAPMTLNLAASPDGRTLLYDRSTPAAELMMIENFR
jgi:Tol biopolymer transport system component/DNA-binding winged helix-turn-helix (wHTH) protein